MQTSLRTCEGRSGAAEFPGRQALSESTNCSIAWRGFAVRQLTDGEAAGHGPPD